MARSAVRAPAYNAARRKEALPPTEWRRILDRNNAARKNNPRKTAWYRKADLKRHYGMTPEEWDQLFVKQGSCCVVCRSSSPGRKTGHWSTDHNHKTGEVRGILCSACNAALGHAKDDPNRLRMLAAYLEKGNHGNASVKAGAAVSPGDVSCWGNCSFRRYAPCVAPYPFAKWAGGQRK